MNTKKQEARKPPAFHVFSSYSGRVLVKCMWGAVLVSVSLSMGKPPLPLADRRLSDEEPVGEFPLGKPQLLPAAADIRAEGLLVFHVEPSFAAESCLAGPPSPYGNGGKIARLWADFPARPLGKSLFCKGFPPVQPQRLAGRPPVWYGNRRLAGYAKKGCLSGEIPARTAHQIPRPLLPPAGPAQRAGVHPRLHRPGGRRTVLQLLLPRLHGGDPRQAPPPRRHRRPLLPDPGDRRGLPAGGGPSAGHVRPPGGLPLQLYRGGALPAAPPLPLEKPLFLLPVCGGASLRLRGRPSAEGPLALPAQPFSGGAGRNVPGNPQSGLRPTARRAGAPAGAPPAPRRAGAGPAWPRTPGS